MDKFSLYAGQFLPFGELFAHKGHRACQGCGVALAVRHMYKSLEEKLQWAEKAQWQIPWQQSLFAKTEQPLDNIKPALLSIPKNKTKDQLSICFDNECIEGKIETEVLLKRMPGIAVASNLAYVATGCPSHPFDLIAKIKQAWQVKGAAYIHILCPCPIGWEFEYENTVHLGRMAVETRLFPLYEVSHGYYHITVKQPNPRPITDYIQRQKRFSHWKPKMIANLQEEVNKAYARLQEKETQSLHQ